MFRRRMYLLVKLCSRAFGLKTRCACQKTPLYDFHLAHGAKMVEFAGFQLPVQYSGQSVFESHAHVRTHCGIFDVSHMLQVCIRGRDRVNFLESLTTADLVNLPKGGCTLSVFLNPSAGVMDDTIISNGADSQLYLVSNAACRTKITEHLKTSAEKWIQAGKEVDLLFLDKNALVAIQGPRSKDLLRTGITNSELARFEDLFFMETASFSALFDLSQNGESIRITRCGYTGEDGYEVSLPGQLAPEFALRLVAHDYASAIGLAARDTLRLEAGLCLYGHELSESITPVMASLSWLISKRRRQASSTPPYPGHDIIRDQLNRPESVTQKRVGLVGSAGPQPRQYSRVISTESKQPVGQVTSGCLSPSLGRNIAMAYVSTECSQPGRELQIEIRDKLYPFTVTTLPFVPNRYVRRPKSKC